MAASDRSGTTATWRYSPYGQQLDGPEQAAGFRYTGREAESNSFYYYRARYYDAEVGRFVSEDPIGFAGGQTNLYAYVGNDPVNFVDPHGEVPWANVISGIAGGAVSGAAEAAAGGSVGDIVRATAVGAATGAINPASVIAKAGVGAGGAFTNQAIENFQNRGVCTPSDGFDPVGIGIGAIPGMSGIPGRAGQRLQNAVGGGSAGQLGGDVVANSVSEGLTRGMNGVADAVRQSPASS